MTLRVFVMGSFPVVKVLHCRFRFAENALSCIVIESIGTRECIRVRSDVARRSDVEKADDLTAFV